jgi:predicted RNase H-like nuclease (RuvC/YqgF family)
MADIIEFGNPKVVRLQRDLKGKDEEIAALRAQLLEAQQRVGQLSSVNDMLKIQLIELVGKLESFNTLLQQTLSNIKTLQSKLPDIK